MTRRLVDVTGLSLGTLAAVLVLRFAAPRVLRWWAGRHVQRRTQ